MLKAAESLKNSFILLVAPQASHHQAKQIWPSFSARNLAETLSLSDHKLANLNNLGHQKDTNCGTVRKKVSKYTVESNLTFLTF